MKHVKLFFALFAMLTLGVGNAWGEDYSIKFLTAASDGSTEITTSTRTSTVLEEASCGYVTGFTNNCTKAYYKGTSGVKLSSSSKSGAIELTLSNTCNQNISKVVFKTVKYKSEASTLTFYAGSSTLDTIAAGSDFSHTFTTPQSVSTLKIASSKRAYISEIIISISSGETTDPTPVTISLNKTELSLQAGATETLTATVTGSTESVTWSSSATSVASVDNTGKVTAIAAGDATITAAIGDVKATCAVTVTAATTPEEPGTGGESAGTPTEVTISFANTNQRVSQDSNSQVWANEGVTFTNSKSASTNPVGDYTNPIRCYASSSMDIEAPGNINKIVFDCNNGSYAEAMKNSIGAAATVSSDKVTVELNGTSTTFNVAKLTAQVRLDNLTVTYTASGSDEPEAEIVKTLKSIAVSGMTQTYQVGDAFSFDGKCTATYSVTIDGVAQADQTAKVEPTSVSTPDMNQLGTQTVTVTYTEGEVTKTAEYTITIEEAPTYNFRKIEGFDNWGSSYIEHIVEYADAKVTFASANKNGQTITDQPVTKGGDVSLVLTDGMNISTVKWVCTQWIAKAQTITLHYSKDGGNVYTSTGITSSDFTISSDNLPAGTNAVKITFSSTDNQVGIKSCTITKVEAAAITQVPAPQFSLPAGAYDGAQSVELTCTMADATIHYTTDGTTPTTTSPVYTTAIQVTENMTIKAYAVKEGLEDSPMVEAVYEISAPADVVLDFTDNSEWGFPTEKTVDATDYTNGGYTVTVAGSEGEGFMFNDNNLMIGKNGSYLVLPIFNKPIEKIVTVGVATGSASVTFNVYIGENAVSTQVKSCKVDQKFLIAEDKQTANVAHTIKVTNENNVRFSKIKLYFGETISDGPTTGVDNVETTVAVKKAIINGQLIIVKDGVQYNAQGQVIK